MKIPAGLIIFSMFAISCSPHANRKPSREVFAEYRPQIETLRELEAKHVRPPALIQISSVSDYTLYLTGNGQEIVSDARKPYPDRAVLQEYGTIIATIHAHCVMFFDDGSFQIVFMDQEFGPPREDGLIFQRDPDAIRSARYPSQTEYLGDGWYAYTKTSPQK